MMLNTMVIRGKMKMEEMAEAAAEKIAGFLKGKEDGGNQFVASALLILFAIGIGIVFYKASKSTTSSLFTSLDQKIKELFNSFSVTD